MEIAAVAITIIYIILEFFQKKLMWIFGILSSIMYILVFFDSKIYADMCFNFYYLTMSFYGLILWVKEDKTNDDEKLIDEFKSELTHERIVFRKLTKKDFIILSSAEVIIYLVLYITLSNLTDSPIPYADALLTSLNIVGTYMLTKRYLVQWHMWIAVNFLSIVIMYDRSLTLTSALYAVYTITSVIGYFKWKKSGTQLSI
ncbi:MAG: nicotinamide riboside transporter PnuC [Bifidobacteriaceae bacterium]|nr:nicotinamide riboside transporter PnuC [Bifidobacteriaceae bacterium]